MDLLGHFDPATLARIAATCGQELPLGLDTRPEKTLFPVGPDGLYDPAAMRAAGWRMVGDDAGMRSWVKDA